MKSASVPVFRVVFWAVMAVWALLPGLVGCRTAERHRSGVDRRASEIIAQKQEQALGARSELDIERPSDILRRRLLLDQELPIAGPASLGADRLEKIEHWPEDDYPARKGGQSPVDAVDAGGTVQLSLIQALEAGARNSLEYQTRKEDVFRSALALDLERNNFRNIFVGQLESLISTDLSGDRAVSGTVHSGSLGVERRLKSGVELSSAIAVDLANLMTMGGASSLGIAGDATIGVPLLRGSGRHIVTEPLVQAERDVLYAILLFERFKKEFAVDIASSYFSVLRQMDVVTNTSEDYRSRIASARRSRRLADAGRLKEIEVDQAEQNQLSARRRWVSANEQYKRQLDAFKKLLGLPPDGSADLDPAELAPLTGPALEIVRQIGLAEQNIPGADTPPADESIDLVEPGRENAGPMEMDSAEAVRLALENRLDLRVAQGTVYDVQRAVVVAADALGPELTLFGIASAGQRRGVAGAGLDDARIRADKGAYSALLTLDLPFERTEEAVDYRDSFILLERAVREVQTLEDQIKLEVRNKLRDMLETRENVYIQARSVFVAQKRVKSVNLFLEAGRAQIRDLLEAQDDLLAAQNGLTSAVVDYRIAELEIQRDMGLLQVDADGLWREYVPGEHNAVEK